MKNGFHKIWRSKFGWLLLLLVLAAVNFIAAVFHARLDLTKEKRYTLSPATKEMLQNLDAPVMIDVFLKGDFPAGFKKLANSTTELLQEFKENGKTNIRFAFHEPGEFLTEGVRYADTLQAMGASPINLKVQLKAGEQQQYLFPVAWVRYKDRSALVNIYSGGRRLITPEEMNSAEAMMEYQFINAINKLTTSAIPFVGYAVGHGEPAGPEVEDLIENTLRPSYRVFTINLAIQPAVPDTFKVLFIVKPSVSFSEEQKLKLDQYVMRGGKIIWVMDNLFAEMDSLQLHTQTIAYERNLNLTDLLFRYGARINPDLIMDLQCDFLPFIVGGTRENPQYEFLKWNYFPLFESRSNHPINKNLRLVSGRFVNSIDTVRADGIRKTFLLQSSANSRIISTPALISLSENKNAPEDEKFKMNNIPAAVLLEGRFRSLYENRLSKEMVDSLSAAGAPFITRNGAENKMIVIADGDIVLNDYAARQNQALPMGVNQYTLGTDFEYQFANRDFILNCVEYLVNNSGIMETRNKDFVLRVLDSKKTTEQKTRWQLINTGLPLLVVIILGYLFQLVRRSKYASR